MESVQVRVRTYSDASNVDVIGVVGFAVARLAAVGECTVVVGVLVRSHGTNNALDIGLKVDFGWTWW